MSNTDSLYEAKYCDVDHVCTHYVVIIKLKYVKFYAGPVFLFSKSLLLCTSVGNTVISSPNMSNTDSLYEAKYCDVDHVCTHYVVIIKLKYVKFYAGPVFLFSKSLLLCTSVGNTVISSPYKLDRTHLFWWRRSGGVRSPRNKIRE